MARYCHLHAGCAKPSGGFTILEVMIALVIMSIGVLGIAGLQLTSKRSNLEATQQATASFLVQELVERMRANAGALETYTNAGTGRVLTGTTLQRVDCSSACTTTQMALHDMAEWERSLTGAMEVRGGKSAGGLPSVRACISGPAGGSGKYTAAVAWRGSTSLNNPTTDTCGQGLALYDADEGTNVRRRVMAFETYISVDF